MGEAVSETGWRFSQVVLHPLQVDVLHNSQPFVYLTGPPGTGKSLVLVLRALDLLSRHQPVHVVSTWNDSLAASYSILYQLRQMATRSATSLIHIHVFNFSEGGNLVERVAVRTLMESASAGEGHGINVIADEAYRGRLAFSLKPA